MPCKSGTRANIEASKVFTQRERELDATDPFRIYWRELIDRVYKSPAGLAQLSDVDRQYWAVECLSGEVYNGGFEQYFHNSSAATYSAAVDGLEAMGATTSLLVLQRAKQLLFGFEDVPVESYARRTMLTAAQSDAQQEHLNEFDKQFCQDPDELAVRSKAFAVNHGLVRVV